ncbi:MAG: helix-hairpin-helix domain-containing protein [Candidatus Eremiobacteraeota bacterium]|nr:helix-hairpin-helix domain-containing protein [Candidatus Eremiobacteraeota bacterium]
MKHDKPRTWIYAGLLAAAIAAVLFVPRHDFEPNLAVKTAVPPSLAGASVDAPSPRPSNVVVYVCGAVRKAGVYRLPADARAVEAVQRAGGTTPDADLDQVNLADRLVDGARLMVPRKGQPSDLYATATTGASVDPSGRSRSHRGRHRGSSSRHKLQPGQTLDVNTATEQELVALPGVGPGLARRIVEYRTANGPFQSVDDLQNVSGIGPSKFDKLSAYIRL